MVVGAVIGSGASIGIVFGLFGACAIGALLLWLTATRETARLQLEGI
jgi:putative MFS transporter